MKRRWKAISESDKFPFVLMSRADEERAKYQLKIAQIRNNLLQEMQPDRSSQTMANDVFTKITQQIDQG